MLRRFSRTGVGPSAGVVVIVMLGSLVTSGCASNPDGVDLVSMPQSTVSGGDLAAGDGAPSSSKPASALSPGNGQESSKKSVSAGGGQTMDATPVLAEARQLRRTGQKAKAMALLDQVATSGRADMAITRERGLLALELGAVDKARDLLKTAAASGPADWRVHSGLGAALASSGQQQEAQLQFARALELAPDHPAILNNLALSYALDGRHDQAEKLLRRAARGAQEAPPQARQNLALLLALKGNTDESRKIAEAALPPTQARANASYLASLPSVAGSEPQPAGTGALSRETPRRSAEVRAPGEIAPVYRLGGPPQ